MFAYILRRLAWGFLLVLAATTASFFLIYAGGANIAANILGTDATEGQVAIKAAELGLDRPLLVQYWDWLSSALAGDLGESYFRPVSVSAAVVDRFWITLSFVVVSTVVVGAVSVALGLVAATRRGFVDRLIQIIAVVGVALPSFWVALVLVLVLAIWLRLLPATGFVPLTQSPSQWLATIAMPVIALSLAGVASTAGQVRNAVIEVLERDFVRTLRARGLSRRRILFAHVLRNAAPPALTVLSLQFIGMMGGAVVIERVFGINGLGSLAVESTVTSDVPMVMGVMITYGMIVLCSYLVLDIVNGWVNPKARG
jgi:peptide/nickel transport system permease protein